MVMERFLRAICTGQSGLSKKDFLTEVTSIAATNGLEVTVFNVGELMCKEAGVPPGMILYLPLKRSADIRRSVYKDVTREASRKSNVIVNTHATFRWKFGLFLALDPSEIAALEPDMFVTLIDDVDAIKLELSRREDPESAKLTMAEIMAWREEEIVVSQLCARFRSLAGVDIPHYILPRMHGPNESNARVLYQLMFEGHRRRVYPSFPITLAWAEPELKARIMDFRQYLRDKFICFDPYDIEEGRLDKELRLALEQDPARESFEITTRGKILEIPIKEVTTVQEAIREQIVARDYQLIDQSDMIIGYLPTLKDGNPAVSVGVTSELKYAHEAGKHVYLICPSEQGRSPFLEVAHEIFKSREECMAFFHDRGWA